MIPLNFVMAEQYFYNCCNSQTGLQALYINIGDSRMILSTVQRGGWKHKDWDADEKDPIESKNYSTEENQEGLLKVISMNR